jgi:hypothetical protein
MSQASTTSAEHIEKALVCCRNALSGLGSGSFKKALVHCWIAASKNLRLEDGVYSSLSTWPVSLQFRTKEILVWLEGTNTEPKGVAASPLDLINALQDLLVQSRTRPSSESLARKTQVEGQNYYVIPTRAERVSAVTWKLPSSDWHHWFPKFHIFPAEIVIVQQAYEVSLADATTAVPRSHDIAIRASHFQDGSALQLEQRITSDQKLFHVAGLTKEDARQSSYLAELGATRNDQCHFWVAPELSTTEGIANSVAQAMAKEPHPTLQLACPGTFHLPAGEGLLDRFINRGLIFNGAGKAIASVEKASLFSYVQASSDTESPDEAQRFSENILHSKTLTVCLTDHGLVGILICKDHLDLTDTSLRAAWDAIDPDWALVPSMGEFKTVDLHRERAKTQSKLRGTKTIVANQNPDPNQNCPGFAILGDLSQEMDVTGHTFKCPSI